MNSDIIITIQVNKYNRKNMHLVHDFSKVISKRIKNQKERFNGSYFSLKVLCFRKFQINLAVHVLKMIKILVITAYLNAF